MVRGCRTWLVGGMGTDHTPPRRGATVQDDQGHTWIHGDDGRFHTPDNRHHASWEELHNRSDLTEVSR